MKTKKYCSREKLKIWAFINKLYANTRYYTFPERLMTHSKFRTAVVEVLIQCVLRTESMTMRGPGESGSCVLYKALRARSFTHSKMASFVVQYMYIQ